jgi:aspartate/methionine/tyrosine aminotransferase
MDGWRVGWLAAPAELLAEIDKAHLRTSTCASSLAQWAALEALRRRDELFGPMLERYTLRRDFIVDLIQSRPGLSCRRPEGTFYVWLNYGERPVGDAAVADYLLEEAGVAVCPGNSFGPSVKGHCRISFASDRPTLEAGITRLGQALERLPG